MDDIHLEDDVLVHEVGGGGVVGDNASYLGGGEENVFRFLGGKESLDVGLTGEVELRVRTRYDVMVALAIEFADDGRTYHATVTGDVDFGCGGQGGIEN